MHAGNYTCTVEALYRYVIVDVIVDILKPVVISHVNHDNYDSIHDMYC